jgi:hypothetical protein
MKLPVGFRVLSAETSSIDILHPADRQTVCEIILNNQTKRPENICCEAMFDVDAIDDANSFIIFEGYGVGPYSDLAELQEKAA